MRHSIKLLLKENKSNEHGQQPVYLRIIINGQVSFISTNEWLKPNQWDAKNERVKSHALEVDINARIAQIKGLASRKVTETLMAGKSIAASELKQYLAHGGGNNIFSFVNSFVNEVKHKRSAGTLENYRKHLLRLELFHGSDNLSFEDITPAFLANYENHLRDEGLGNNYVHALFKTLKVIFNAAKKRGIVKDYPFEKYENPVYNAPTKDYLTMKEILAIEEFADKTNNPMYKQTAIYFLLGVSTGLRISDWHRFNAKEHIKDGQVLLRAKKNGEWVSMPVNSLLKRNLPRIAKTPLTIAEAHLNRALKDIAKTAGTSKHITSHTARHTFAIEICANRGLSVEVTAELMGITIATAVENYYKVSQRKINTEALRAWKGL